METITINTDFSNTVMGALVKQNKAKRWLYYQLNMAPITFESRLKNNDWRLDEIVQITNILGLK